MEMTREDEKIQVLKEDLEDLEMYIKEFSNFLPLPVCTVNPMGVIVNINKAVETITGYNLFELVGQDISVIFLEKEEIKKIEKAIKQREAEVRELTLLTKEKKKIPVRIYSSIRKDREGNYLGYFLAFFDISEIKALQESLEEKVRERTKELQEKIRELEKFQKLVVGRELKMIELKKEIKNLKEELKKMKN
jgi:PAS domain S-box-containing protein